jgi:hypothetical protein
LVQVADLRPRVQLLRNSRATSSPCARTVPPEGSPAIDAA